jgi:hypothetical protein
MMESDGERAKLHEEKLQDLYSSPNTVREIVSKLMIWAGHVACMGERRGAYRIVVDKPVGKIQLGRPRRQWKDNTYMGVHGLD